MGEVPLYSPRASQSFLALLDLLKQTICFLRAGVDYLEPRHPQFEGLNASRNSRGLK